MTLRFPVLLPRGRRAAPRTESRGKGRGKLRVREGRGCQGAGAGQPRCARRQAQPRRCPPAAAPSGVPGSARRGPARCKSGREQARPVSFRGAGEVSGCAGHPQEPHVPLPGVLEAGKSRTERARPLPCRRGSLTRFQPEGSGGVGGAARRAAAAPGAAVQGAGVTRAFRVPGSPHQASFENKHLDHCFLMTYKHK